MQIKLVEIVQITGGLLKGDKNFEIENVGSLTYADKKSISYLADENKTSLLKNTKAGALILPSKLRDQEIGYKGNKIFCQDAHQAFIKLLVHYQNKIKPKKGWGTHPTAVVDSTAKIGKYTFIGANCIVGKNTTVGDFTTVEANCFIGENCKIGSNTFIYPNVTIRENCSMGNKCIIHSGVVIGADGFGYIKHEGRHHKIPQVGSVKIEDDVEIGANTTIDRAALDETVIGEGTKIDNLVQIAHNVIIGKNCIIVAQAGIAGSSVIGDGTIISGQAGIVDHVKVGKNAVIIAQSGITKDVEDGKIMFGSPARPYTQAVRLQAMLNRLPKIYELFRKLKKGG
jgi:UDP-3-O-[3-hydroxymyristoyl] glucosamine N-acyltransferase